MIVSHPQVPNIRQTRRIYQHVKTRDHRYRGFHFHSRLDESILILSGELLFSWQDQGKTYDRLLKEGTVVRVKDSVHTFSNTSSRYTSFVVFRFIPNGQDKREMIKNDKTIVRII